MKNSVVFLLYKTMKRNKIIITVEKIISIVDCIKRKKLSIEYKGLTKSIKKCVCNC